jgi:hypothetical protein
MSSAGSARSFYCHGGTARGPRLAAGAVGELGSARSPGAVGRKKHGFRSGFGRRGSCSWFRANFLHRLGERAEFFRHRERFLVTSLHTPPSSEKEGRAASLLLRVLPPGGAGSDGGLPFPAGFHRAGSWRRRYGWKRLTQY